MGDAILTQFFSGFSMVAILIIAALGLAVIFGVAGVINMAHGEFIMVGAYVASVVQSGLGGNTSGRFRSASSPSGCSASSSNEP